MEPKKAGADVRRRYRQCTHKGKTCADISTGALRAGTVFYGGRGHRDDDPLLADDVNPSETAP